MLSLALAGILGATCAVVEESGAFAGVQAGYGAVKYEYKADGNALSFDYKNGARFGLIGGYKGFLNQNFGYRFYGVIDFGKYKEKIDNPLFYNGNIQTFNFNINLDALYNFVSSGSLDFGAFAGLSAGSATHKFKDGDNSVSGFDAGVNLGLRANITKAHGIELYSRFDFIEQEKNSFSEFDESISIVEKIKQPYQVGLRYTFSF